MLDLAAWSSARHYEMGKRGIGVCSFTVGVPPENLAERFALYRKGLAECEKPLGRFKNERVGGADREARHSRARSRMRAKSRSPQARGIGFARPRG